MTRRLWQRWVAHRRAMAARLVARHALLTRRPVPTRLLVALTGDGAGRFDLELASWPGGRMFVPPLRELETDAPPEATFRADAREIIAPDERTVVGGSAESIGVRDSVPRVTADAPETEPIRETALATAQPPQRVAPAINLPAASDEAVGPHHRPTAAAAARASAAAVGPGDVVQRPSPGPASVPRASVRPPRRAEVSAPTQADIDAGVPPEVRPRTLPELLAIGSLGEEPATVPVRDSGGDSSTPLGHQMLEEAEASAQREPVEERGGRDQISAHATPRDPVAPARDATAPARTGPEPEVRDDPDSAVSSPTAAESPNEPGLAGSESLARPAMAEAEFPADSAASVSRPDAILDIPTDIKSGQRPAVAEERHARRPAPLRDGSGARDTGRPAARPGDAPPLFEARHPNRSASDWLKLLVEATQIPKSAADAPPKPQHRPTASDTRRTLSAPPARTPARTPSRTAAPLPRDPLLQSTRRFLRPLVGVDPDTVAIYRGPRATAMADAVGADAVAIGETVVLPPTHDERTPEGRGLIAHELTHVAQRRADAAAGRRATPAAEPQRQLLDTEERTARTAEAVVRSAAAHDPDRPNARPTRIHDLQTPDAGTALPEFAGTAPPSDEGTRSTLPSFRRQWGTLPAPWEPIPELESSAPSAAWSSAPYLAASASLAAPLAPASAGAPRPSATLADAPSAPEVRLAAADRPAAAATEASPQHATDTQGARPDAEQLARQVYDILKRQLAAERRRGA